MDDEGFYIGWQDEAPRRLRPFLKRLSLLLIAGGALVAALVVAGQPGYDLTTFEFLNYRTFEGVIEAAPYPMLHLDRPGRDGATTSAYYLVQAGKYGAQEAVAGLGGRRVRLEGALIYRDDQTMIELRPGTVKPAESAAGPPAQTPVALGTVTLTGEVVDSKCYLGVMNPGDGKAHAACASLCIRGGIPPVFAVRAAAGPTAYLLLLGADGRTLNQEVLGVVGHPLSITGDVTRIGDRLFLRAEPDTYQVLR